MTTWAMTTMEATIMPTIVATMVATALATALAGVPARAWAHSDPNTIITITTDQALNTHMGQE